MTERRPSPDPSRNSRTHARELRRNLYDLGWGAGALVRKRVDDLMYRLRPERPLIGLEYVQFCADARASFFPGGQGLEIDIWNTFKGRREAYYDLLCEQTLDADLVLLQEFRYDPALAASHRELLHGRDAAMAINFYTGRQQEAPTGVCTMSNVRAVQTIALTSKYLEPITRTPKTALCTAYPVGSADCSLDDALVVVNSHSINFRLRRPFQDQVQQLEAQLTLHHGPIILVGDFNTWERGRVQILEAVATRIGLQRVMFPAGVKTVRGHELDRVYIRGGKATHQRVFHNQDASDHSMLSFKFWIG